MNLTMAVLGTLFLILITGISWVTIRTYSQRLSLIDDELQSIKVMLSETPKETLLKDYMFAQDQRLQSIGERLKSTPDTDVLQQLVQDQANQIIAVMSTHDASRSSVITRSELNASSQLTNGLLERVLWSLRFDENRYAESNGENTNKSGDQGEKNTSLLHAQNEQDLEDPDDNALIQSILNDRDDSYGAMLEYMGQTGKSGSEALHALEAARFMGERS